MSRVFVAEETQLGRRVVIKVLPPELAAAISTARFQREIAVAARLQHPHIVPVLTAGELDGIPYYTMPLVEGESLRARLARSGPLPIGDTLAVLRDVAKALAFAHAHGVVHRDVKPDNVLLSAHSASVTDFGIAKALFESRTASDDTLTQLGMALGTPAYMSPEQASGDVATDHRADLYAFGVMAYELLTGAPPFHAQGPAAVIAAHISEQPTPVGTRRAGVPPALSTVVMRCLAKDPAERPSSADEVLAALEEIPHATPVPLAARARRRAMAAGAAALLLLAGAGAWLAVGARSGVRRSAAASAAVKSVAVLPLVNVSGDTANEYFSDGMTDELTSALSRVPGLRVASRTSAFSFKHRRDLDVRAIGRRLNVGAVLEGTVRRSGDRLRVTTQLIDVEDGLALWTETYEHRITDVFQVQDSIARSIVSALRLELAPQQAARGLAIRPRNLEAHDLYLRGLYQANRYSEASLRRAIALYEQALQHDPGYALAYNGISAAWSLLADDWVPPHEAYPAARAAAERALQLDESSANAHVALASVLFLYDWDHARARRELDRALELDPHSIGARQWYSQLYAAQGRFAESEQISREGLALDPVNLQGLSAIATTLIFADRAPEAVTQARRTMAQGLETGFTQFVLGTALLMMGRYDEALPPLARARELGSEFRGQLGTAFVHAAAGRPAEARRIARALEEESRRRYVPPDLIGRIYAALGERDEAFRWMERAFAARSSWLRWLKVDPFFDGIRSDPRFPDLVRRAGLPVD